MQTYKNHKRSMEWKLNWPQTADGCGRYEPKKKWRKE